LIAIDIALSAALVPRFVTILSRRLIRLAGRTLLVAGLAGSYGWTPPELPMQQDSRFQIIGEGEGSAGDRHPRWPIRPRGRTMSISAPILSSFQKLDTRGACNVDAARRGGVEAGGDGAMRGRNRARTMPMASAGGQRVIIRTVSSARHPNTLLIQTHGSENRLAMILTDNFSRTDVHQCFPWLLRFSIRLPYPN
jgi:hypothetical protein